MINKSPALGILLGLFIFLQPGKAFGQSLELTAINPTSGTDGTSFAIYGAGLDGSAASHTITFQQQNGAATTASIDSLGSTGKAIYGKIPPQVGGLLDVIVQRSSDNDADTLHSAFSRLTQGGQINEDTGAGLDGVVNGSSDWGDFDGDGDLDLVVTGDNGSSLTATIYENDGAGNFIPLNAGLNGVVNGSSDWGDFDGDGDLDLVITGNNGSSNTATVYENNGGGNFTPLGAGLNGVVDASLDWSDFDGDGDPDLVVSGYNGSINTATIYENDGSGGFSPLGAGLTGAHDGSIEWGDVDGDGDPDLIITGLDGSGRTATIYENDGSGGFSPLAANLTGVRNSSSDWGDFEGDGDLDLVVTGDNGSSFTSTIYENDGTGSFTPLGAGLTGVRNGSSEWGDVDADGNLDLVITGDPGSGRSATIYKNDGTGSFSALGAGLAGVFHSSSEWGDVDDDGDLDLLVTGENSSNNPTATLYLNSVKPGRASVNPSDQATGVAVDANPEITFDQAVSEVDLSGVTITDEDGTSAGNVSAALTDSTITIAHDDFARGVTYTVTVPAGAVRNNDGATSTKQRWSFTSIKPAPVAASFTPTNGSTGIALDSTISITFNQEVSEVDLSGITITDVDGNPVSGISASMANNSITITHDDFANNNEYTVTVPAGAVENTDGVANPEESWSFTSIKAAPVAAGFAPADGSIGIPVDSALHITFNQPVSTADLTGITVTNQNGASAGNVTATLSDSTIVITHDDLNNNETYTVTVPNGAVQNTDGVANPEESWSFTSIKAAPVAASVNPAEGSAGIAVDSTLSITFDQTVSEVDLSGITITDEDGNRVSGVSASMADSTIAITHDDFVKNQTYTATIPEGAVQNTDGVGNTEQSWSFTSIKPAPVAASFAPADGSTRIAIDSTLSITFDQQVMEGELSGITVTDQDGNPAGNVSGSLTDSTITITHDNFAHEQIYTVTIPAGAVQNTDGVANPGQSWSFTTITAAPLAANIFPAGNSTGIAVDSTLGITFDQGVSEVDLSGITVVSEDGTPAGNVSGSLTDSTITIAHDDFARGVTYTVTVPAGAVENAGGVANKEHTWSFTSIKAAPVAASFAPTDGSAGIAVDSTLSVTFGQTVSQVDLSGITITDEDGNTVSGVSASMTDSTIAIVHDDFAKNRTYTATIPEGAVQNTDGVGNLEQSWSFTSIKPAPVAASFAPADGSIRIAADSTLSITFDQSVSAADLSGITITGEDGSTVGNVSGTLTDSTITIAHDNFARGITYTATIPAGAVENTDGVANTAQSWNFTTIKPAPAAASFAPADGSTGIAVDSTLSITFDQAVSEADLSGIAVTDEDGNTISGISATLADSTISITHDDFARGVTFTAAIPAGAVLNTDSVANPRQSWSFTSIKPAPVAVGFVPADSSAGIAVDSTLRITFDQTINGANLSGITITDEDGNQVSGVTATVADSTISITHDDFANDEMYTVDVPAGAVQNTDGVANARRTWSFTSIKAAPVAAGFAPADSSTGIAVDNVLSVTFDQKVSEADLSGITITDASGNSADSVSGSLSDSTIAITHEEFARGVTYTVTIPAGAVQNSDGVANPMQTWEFTTIKPAPVAADFAPAEGSTRIAVDSALSITFDQPVSGAELSAITITDEAGAPVTGIATSLADSTISITHDEFDKGVTYTVTVPAGVVENTDGVANTAQSWSFTTIKPAPVAASLTPGDGSTGISVQSALSITFGQPVSKVDLSGITVANAAGSPVSGVSATMDDSVITIDHAPLKFGKTYTVTIPAGAVENTDGIGNPELSWSFTTKLADIPDQITASVNVSFGDASSEEDYRLVALPGAVNAPLSDKLTGQAGINWNATWDDGSPEDYLIEYDSSDTFTFRPGNGFWVTSIDSFKNTETLPMIETEDRVRVRIPLHSDWNIISNPLHIDVSWSDVQAANEGTLQPIWDFTGSFSQSPTFSSAKNGKAFYFLNDRGLSELIIPIQPVVNRKQKPHAKKPEKASVHFHTYVDEDTASTSRLVLAEGSSGHDDVIAPPGGFEQASLRFLAREQGDNSSRTSSLAGIFRRQPTDGQRYGMILRAAPGQPVTIGADGWTPAVSSNLILVNKQTGRSYQLHEKSRITVTPQENKTEWVVLMGSNSYVEREKENILPDQLTVLPNYPNPFNPETTIEFALPEKRHVQLRIYNMLGRRVATLVNEERQGGLHKVTFNGGGMSSGVYFAIFNIEGQRFVQKLTLIK